MDIRIADTVIHPSHKTHFYVKKASKNRFKVYISLKGNDVPFVDSVIYYLHPTFKNPTKHVSRSVNNPDCSIIIWTWGLFEVRAKVYLKNGETLELTHFLNYDKEIKSNPSLKPQFA